MKKSKIFALIGNIIFTLLALFGIGAVWILLVVQQSNLFKQQMNMSQFDAQTLITALIIAFSLIFILMIFNWIAFARLNKGRGWRNYFLVLGIFYGVTSLFNGVGLVVTLPVAVCFILTFVLRKHECLDEK